MKLYIVIPCYNEEAMLPITFPEIDALLRQLIEEGRVSGDSRILFVDDGSRDGTWNIISKLTDEHELVEGLKLAHNAGHQNALWAGMLRAMEQCDALISIDADLQDDVGAIRRFLDEYEAGADIVYGVRSKRASDSWFKRFTAQSFYRLMAWMGVETVYNHADYRLMSRRAVRALSEYGEVNLFLRGMVPTLGFRTAVVPYERGVRVAGESKYPLTKMLAFAAQGITSFSVKPIRLILFVGILAAVAALAIGVYVLISLFSGHAVAGWTSTMLSIWLIGGLQLIALGLIGEYIGKIYLEVKRRPKFIVEEYRKHD